MSSRVAGDVATTCGRVRLQLTLAVVRASCRAHEAKGDPSAREHTGGSTHSLCDCVAAEGRVQAEQRGRPPLPLPRRNKLRPFRHARRGDSTAGASCTRPHPPYPPFANVTRPRRLMALALATNRHMRARQPGARLRPVPLCAPHARARRRARLLCTRMRHTARCLLSILTRWPAALNPDAPFARARALADPHASSSTRAPLVHQAAPSTAPRTAGSRHIFAHGTLQGTVSRGGLVAAGAEGASVPRRGARGRYKGLGRGRAARGLRGDRQAPRRVAVLGALLLLNSIQHGSLRKLGGFGRGGGQPGRGRHALPPAGDSVGCCAPLPSPNRSLARPRRCAQQQTPP